MVDRSRRLAILVAAGALLVAAPRARASGGGDALPAAKDRSGSGSRVLALCIDGLQARVFERLLAAGKLPSISRLVERCPSVRGRALASFPSSTAPSIPELLTGRYADRTAGMPRAIHAFERASLSARRYSLEPAAWEDGTPTLFTLLGSRGQTSFSLFEGKFEGSDSFSSKRELIWGGILEKLRIRVYNPDSSLLRQFRHMVEVRGVPPRVAFLVLNSVDLAGHLRSPDSERYARSLEELDALLGSELLDWMEGFVLPDGRTYLESTTIAIFGDHGMEDGGRLADLGSAFKKMKLRVRDLGSVFQVALRERFSTHWAERPDVVLAPGGSNVAQVYLRRSGESWSGGPASEDETRHAAEALVRVLGVELVVRRLDADTLEIRSAGRRTALVVSGGEGTDRTFAYRVEAGELPDPLGYLADPLAARLVDEAAPGELLTAPPAWAFHTFASWHASTRRTEYPAAVPLLVKGCAAGPSQGDLTVTSSRGYSFLRHTAGDHGGLRKDSVETALVFAGPAVREGSSLDGARLIDLLPTFLEMLDLEADPDFLLTLDGHALPIVERPGGPTLFLPPVHLASAAGPASPGPPGHVSKP